MGEHTPGPWRIGFEDGSGFVDEEDGAWITGLEDEIVVAGGSHEGLKYGVPNLDNARVIAAAPDLLEAAKRAYACFEIQAEKRSSDNGDSALDDLMAPEALLLREAIAKAEGVSGVQMFLGSGDDEVPEDEQEN